MAEAAVDAVLTLTVESCRGYSAYELAVQHGFRGTEEEWLGGMVAEGNVTVNGKSKDVNGNIRIGAADVLTEGGDSVQAALDDQAQAACELDTALQNARKELTELENEKLSKEKLFNDLTQDQAGYALDARQGKVLAERIGQTKTALEDELSQKQDKLSPTKPLAVACGGTGAASAEGARDALGLANLSIHKLQHGVVTLTVAAGATKAQSIAFAEAFKAAPHVWTNTGSQNASRRASSATGITTAGCTINAENTGTTEGNIPVYWFAIGI